MKRNDIIFLVMVLALCLLMWQIGKNLERVQSLDAVQSQAAQVTGDR